MLALDFVKANRETVERAIRDKGVELDLDALLALDAEVRARQDRDRRLRAERNAVSAGFKDAAPEEKAELGRQAKESGRASLGARRRACRQGGGARGAAAALPGIPYEGAPVGPDESSNIVIRTEGDAAASSTSSRSTMSR